MLSYLDRTYSIQLGFDAFNLRSPRTEAHVLSLLVEQVRDFDSAQPHGVESVGNVKESLSS